MKTPSTKQKVTIEYSARRQVIPCESLFTKTKARALKIASRRPAAYRAWYRGELIFENPELANE